MNGQAQTTASGQTSAVSAPHRSWRGRLLAVSMVSGLILIGLLLVYARHRPLRPAPSPFPTQADLSRQDAWSAQGGTWRPQSQPIENSSEDRGAKLVSRLGSWQDLQLEADVRIAEPYGEAGLLLRTSGEEEGVDAYHGYYAGIRTMDSSLEFGRADFGWHPLARVSLPTNVDLQQWMHLRVVALGCTFGVVLTLPDHQTRSLIAQDDACIAAGHFGLRSSLTSAEWNHVRLSPAALSDLPSPLDQTPPAEYLPVSEPFVAKHALQYEDSMRTEARKHALQAGVRPILDYLMQPGRHENVTIQGVVTSLPPLMDVQDDTNALLVAHVSPSLGVKLGDVVEVHGALVSERFRSRMEDADVRILWSDTPLPPLAVTAAQLTSGTYRGHTVEVEGTLLKASTAPAGYELILRDGDLTFRCIGSPDFQLNVAHLEDGSRVRVRGLATSLPAFTNNVYPFAVVVTHTEIISAPPWWSPRHIVVLVLLILLLLLAAQFMVHRLQQWHLESVLKEREHLAFEMHDTLAQSFTGIAYQLKAASMERRGEARILAHVGNALAMVHLSHKEASRTIAALRPQFRDAAAILTALRESAERLSDGGSLEIITRLSGRNNRLPVQVTDALFRIGQEAISNAIQHSACDRLTLELALSRREAHLSVYDNGCGFQPLHEGLGIAAMRSRADKIRAHFTLSSDPLSGTRLEVHAPLRITGGLLKLLRDVWSSARRPHP